MNNDEHNFIVFSSPLGLLQGEELLESEKSAVSIGLAHLERLVANIDGGFLKIRHQFSPMNGLRAD
jgi:hypothetical protein